MLSNCLPKSRYGIFNQKHIHRTNTWREAICGISSSVNFKLRKLFSKRCSESYSRDRNAMKLVWWVRTPLLMAANSLQIEIPQMESEEANSIWWNNASCWVSCFTQKHKWHSKPKKPTCTQPTHGGKQSVHEIILVGEHIHADDCRFTSTQYSTKEREGTSTKRNDLCCWMIFFNQKHKPRNHHHKPTHRSKRSVDLFIGELNKRIIYFSKPQTLKN